MSSRLQSVLFLILFFGGVAVSSASAKSIYVATNGNDGNSGTITSPVASLRRAYDLAAPGDSIYLRGGRYTVTSDLFVEKDNLTFSSQPGETAVIAGSTSDTSGLQNIFNIVSNSISLINLEIQGGSYYVVKTESNTGMLIRNCRLQGSGRDCIKMFNADNATIEGCEIGPSGVRDSSNAEGIDSVGSRNTIVRACYVHDTATTGIYVKGGASGCVIEGNRVERTGHAGILLGQDTDPEFMRDGTQYEALNSVARNNVVSSAGGAGIGAYSANNVRFENNTLFDVARSFHGGFYVSQNGRETASQRVTFKNNIVIVTSDRPMAFIINLSDRLVSDSNIWFRPNGGVYRFYREGPSTGDFWQSFAAWQTGLGVDSRSLTSDPLLDSSRLFKLRTGSPAIDRGETIAGVLVDFSGVQRPQGLAFDIGAYETPAAPPANQRPVAEISASPASGIAPLNVTFIASASDSDGRLVSYSWDFGDGQTSALQSPVHLYAFAGSFTARLTVADDGGATTTASTVINVTSSGPSSVENIIWTSLAGCIASGNSLTKTAATIWGNAGAASQQSIRSGGGFAEFTALETDKERVFGLSNSNPDQNFQSIAFGIYLNTGGAFYVMESGVNRGYFGDYITGDLFRVAIDSGAVKYSRNGRVFYTSSRSVTYPLIVDAALQGFGATIYNAKIGAGSGGSTEPGPIRVTVLKPTKGEVLQIGSEYEIGWSVTGSEAKSFDISISYDGGGAWKQIVSGLSGSLTTYRWTVRKPKSKAVLIRVTARGVDGLTAEDVSDLFSIVRR